MIAVYRSIVAVLFYCALPVLLLIVLVTGRHRRDLTERFGLYPKNGQSRNNGKTVWVHAASVGEVQAARLIIGELRRQLPHVSLFLTCMTVHGKRIAQSRIHGLHGCFLAPLDVPWITERALRKINPDIYICLETELWPVLFDTLTRVKVPLCLVNGRMSEKSYRKYKKMSWLVAKVVQQFDTMAVISERDRRRYISLGAEKGNISVEGNVKYDLTLPPRYADLDTKYRDILKVVDEEVLIAGSTHPGEEDMIVELHLDLRRERSLLTIIVPRHVERIGEIESDMQAKQIPYQLFSNLQKGEQRRRESIVFVDIMGELALLYSIADFVFCGGSLVDKGGHNLMEAALWHKVVFYGPYIGDFHDAAELLSTAGGGFVVENSTDLAEHIRYFRSNPAHYQKACMDAGQVARLQQGSASRQVSRILNCL